MYNPVLGEGAQTMPMPMQMQDDTDNKDGQSMIV